MYVFFSAGMQIKKRGVKNSRNWKGAATVWLNLPSNLLRARGDLSQLKNWVKTS